MASDARAAKRRASRAGAKGPAKRTTAAKAKGNRRKASEKPPALPAGPEASQQDGVLVTVLRDESGGFAIDRILPVGDVRVAEMETMLGKALKVYRERAGVD